MYPKKKPGLVAQNTDNQHSTERPDKEAIIANDEKQQMSGRRRTTKTTFPSFTSNISEDDMDAFNHFEHLPSRQYRMSLRSRDAPAGAPRMSYAEDLCRSDVDEDDDEEYDYKEEEPKPSAARHKRRYITSHASHDPHTYNGHRFGRRGDPRMTRSLQIKLDNPDMDCTLALIQGGYRYDVGTSDKTLDEDGITLGQRRNQLARRVRNERRKTGGVQLPRRKKRPAGNRKKTTKQKKSRAVEPTNRSVSRPISPSPPTSVLPIPPLPPMSLNYEADDPYDFERMESEAVEKDYPPLPPLPSGEVEIPLQQQLDRIRKEELQRVESPYISDISDVEGNECRSRGEGNTAGIATCTAAAAAAPPFPTLQGAPLIPSLPVTPSMSFAPKPKEDTESVVGENLLEEDMLGLTEEEKQEAHDDVHGYRELDSSLMQTVMNKFLCINKDGVEATIRDNKAIGKSVENLMSPAVKNLIRQMKIEIEARPQAEKDSMLKAFVRCSPAQRQVEFGDERLELFLRREHVDPKAAAARFVKYWAKRKEVFGSEKYFLPLDIEGALKDDRVALEVGHWIILPEPDTHGRTIMLWLKRGPYDFDSMVSDQASLYEGHYQGSLQCYMLCSPFKFSCHFCPPAKVPSTLLYCRTGYPPSIVSQGHRVVICRSQYNDMEV